MWRAACELAERTAGTKLTAARVLELVAAEASGSVPPAAGSDPPGNADPAIRDLLDKLRSARSARAAVAEPGTGSNDGGKGDSGSGGGTTSGVGMDDVAARDSASGDGISDDAAPHDAPTDGAVHEDAGSMDGRDAPTGEGRSGHSGYDWREGLESRDPELAAFLAECEREEAAARDDSVRRRDESVSSTPMGQQQSSTAGGRDVSTAEHRPYDWREGLAERDPQLAAFLAACEAEDAARERADATMQDADPATLDCGDRATPKRGNGATQDRGDDAAGPRPNAPPSFASILHDVAAREDLPWLVPPVPADATGPCAWLERHMHAIESADPFVIDGRLREVRRRVHRLDFDLASLLREAARRRLYRDFGFANLESYVEFRLGICPRTAWTLLAIERACSRTSPRLADAWQGGRISTMAAHAILRVLGHGHDDDWIARAGAVMLRRLEAEVDWARARLAEGRTGEPPPEGLDLTGARLAGVTTEELQMRAREAQPPEATGPSEPTSTDELQMRAHETQPAEATASPEPFDAEKPQMRAHGEASASSDPSAAEELQMRAHGATAQTDAEAAGSDFAAREQIAFFAPKSVCILATETMLALRTGSEPRGRAFERMLALAMLEWMAAPRHRDPVFERDGWCCSVPGCTSRRNLHDHHIVFRSHGGDNARDNRITVCAAHHLHGLHRGRIRAYGRAPGEVAWEIGIRFGPGHGGKPLFRTVGDRYVRPAPEG